AKIHPYFGIGLMYVNHSWSGTGPAPGYDGSGVDSGLYLVGGARYYLNSNWAADLNFNVFSDLTVGVVYSF
ncbi:MAG: hypothetical protein WCE58_00460, partial [Gallionella sp.]